MNSKVWVLALLLANGASAGLIFSSSDVPVTTSEPLPVIGPAIRLLDEIEPVPIGPRLPVQQPIMQAQPRRVCLVWGPFNDQFEAAPLAAEIRMAGGNADVVEARLQGKPDYLVLIGPAGSSDVVRRMHKELESLSIESHVISTGRFANTVSIGVFTEHPRALAQQQRVAALGYRVGIEELDRSQRVYHLLAEVSPDFTGSREPNGDCADIAPEHQFL